MTLKTNPKMYNACQVLLEKMGIVEKSDYHKLPNTEIYENKD